MRLELLAEGSERHTGYVSRKQIRIGIWSPEFCGVGTGARGCKQGGGSIPIRSSLTPMKE